MFRKLLNRFRPEPESAGKGAAPSKSHQSQSKRRRPGSGTASHASRGPNAAQRPPREPHAPAHSPREPRAPRPEPAAASAPATSTKFADLGLAEAVLRGAEATGYTAPTPIQERAIPIVLTHKDLIGSAQTGTGKTAAFALPILSLLGRHRQGPPRVLILEPTRELAMQVEEAFRDYGRFSDLHAAAFYGGVGYGKQRADLKRGVDVMIATPGRLLDYLQQKETSLANVEILVLDEVDRMLDMGFLPDVRRLVERCPPRDKRQTLFFSATLPPEIERLTEWALRPNPEIVEIGERRSPAETVAHAFYPVASAQKFDLLTVLLEKTQYHSVLVFARTKHGSDRIAKKLQHEGHSVAVLHGNRSQNQRIEALAGFKSGKYEVMVATDIAARGLDVAGITHVINYDIPTNPEDYVHRIGRTGRAQREGDAFTLITQDDAEAARDVEKYLGEPVERQRVEGFNYAPIPAESKGPGPARGGGRGGGRGRSFRGGRR